MDENDFVKGYIMEWYCVRLEERQVAEGVDERFREKFETAFVAAKGPREMALFKRLLPSGQMEFYATAPSMNHASELLREHGATFEEKIDPRGLTFAVGHNEATYFLL